MSKIHAVAGCIVPVLRFGTFPKVNSSKLLRSSSLAQCVGITGTMDRSNSRLLCIANHCKATQNSPKKFTDKAFANGSLCPPITPGVVRFYNMRFCPFAQRTRLVLEYKKIPYEVINVNLKYKPDWLFEKNPQGLVPIIEKDELVIYESTATSEWLDDMYPENRLQNDDPSRKAWDRMLLEYFGQLTGHMHRLLRRPELRESIVKKTKKYFHHYEDALTERGGSFFGGAQLAMIDFYMWPHMERIPAMALIEPELAVNPAQYPRLAKWFDCMNDRPEVKATKMDVESHLHFLKSLAAGNGDYDYGLDS